MIESPMKSMWISRPARIFAVALLAVTLHIAAPARAQGPASVADLAEELSGAVVYISTTQEVNNESGIEIPELPPNAPFREFFEDFFNRQRPDGNPRQRASSLGSGFVIGADGIIVTNNHVIQDADKIEVTFTDGTVLSAEVIGRDTKTDIALLRVEPESPLTAVPMGNSDTLRVGDWVMAIGNPFGLGGTVTVGIVSARNRDIDSGPYDDFIQTDAAINRGNSGGPLFNMQGEVIGINTAIISPLPSGGSVGIGFAIPTSTASPVINQLREFGETRRGWLGVRIQSLNESLAESLGLDEPHGALVADVTEGGPAEAAGLEPGDVIVRFDGRDVPEMRDLPKIVAETAVGSDVDVVVIRNGEEVSVPVTLGRLEDGERLMASQSASEPEQPGQTRTVQSALGLNLSPLTDDLRTQFEISGNVDGVLIVEVEPESSAAEKRIRPGDVIVKVDKQSVETPGDVVRLVRELEDQGRSTVLLLLASKNGDLRFAALRFTDN